MAIYIVITLLLVLGSSHVSSIERQKRRRKVESAYCLMAYAVLIFMSAFRGASVGTDTPVYMANYELMRELDFSKIFELYSIYIGYYIPVKLCCDLHAPVQVWQGIVAAVYITSMAKLFSRYSEDRLFSVLCFFLMGSFAFSLAGMKQTFAMGLVLWGFLFFLKRRYALMTLLTVWAYFVHPVTVVFVLAYPLFFIRDSKAFYLVLLVLAAVTAVAFQFIIVYATSVMGIEKLAEYLEEESSATATGLIYYVLLLLLPFSTYQSKLRKRNDPFMRFVFGMCVLCTVFQIFAFANANAFRLSLYYLPFFALYLPNITSGKNHLLKAVTAVMIIFFFFYTTRDGSSTCPYLFIWDDPLTKSMLPQ